MLAEARRMAIHDFLLIACAVSVIALSAISTPENRQIVEIRDRQGNAQRYSLAPDDPRLAKLRSELTKWNRPKTHAPLTLAKWHAELAEFYAMKTQPSTRVSPIQQVLYIDRDPTEAQAEARAWNRQHHYWLDVLERAEVSVANLQRKQNQAAAKAKPPIVFAEIRRSGPAASEFAIAGIAGLGIALAFACWVYVCPAIGLRSESEESTLRSLDAMDDERQRELRLSIPPQWIRIHQPKLVVLRRIAYGTLVLAAIVCSLKVGVA